MKSFEEWLKEKDSMNESDWMQDAVEKPGALHRQLGVPKDEKIPVKELKKAAKAPGKLGKRARLALTFKKVN